MCIDKQETKVCSRCQQELPIGSFAVSKRRRKKRDGTYYDKVYTQVCGWCKPCKRENDRLLYKKAERKANVLEATRKYQNKPDQLRKRRKRSLLKNHSCNVYIRKCKDCDKIDVLRKTPRGIGKEYCSKCVRVYSFKGRTHEVKVFECVVCGVDVEGKPGTKYCIECGEQRKKELTRLSRKKYGLNGSIRKRCKRYGVYYEPVNRMKVFKRDRWKCKHCGVKVQTKDIYQDNAAEWDHIVPLSKGGPHTYTNLQTLCRQCNIEKGDSLVSGTQFTLFVDAQRAS